MLSSPNAIGGQIPSGMRAAKPPFGRGLSQQTPVPSPDPHRRQGRERWAGDRPWWPARLDIHAALLYLAVWAIVAAASESGLLRPVELLEVDILLLATAPQAPRAPIVVVTIDEDTLAEKPLRPFPRGWHAQLVDRLNQAGARVIALDVALIEPSDPKEDHALAEAIRRSHAVVVLAGFMDWVVTSHVAARRRIHPLLLFIQAGAVDGDVTLPLDEDMVVRRMPTATDSFWRRTLEMAGWRPPDSPPEAARLIRSLPPGSIPRIHYYQALDPAAFLPPDAFTDKIVLVGWATQASPDIDKPGKDIFATPHSRSTGSLTSGVEILASAIDTAYCGNAIAFASTPARLVLLAFVALLAYPLLCPWSPVASAATTAAGTLGLLALGGALFILGEVWLSIAGPMLGLLASFLAQGGLSLVRERRRVRSIRGAFYRYVSADVVDKILERPERLVLGGERREVTFVFTDLTGFTAMTELMEPEQLVDVLRRYFDGMCGIVLSHGGTIERLTGDGLVAFFNAPVAQPDHPERAVRCALALDSFSRQFEQGQAGSDVPVGNTRIGVNTGWVTVGNFGSSTRFHYTAMGDAINTAARLEAANKHFGTRVSVSGVTRARCPTIRFRPVADILLTGKHRAISVFEPVTHPESGPEMVALQRYQEAFDGLKRGDPGSLTLFQQLAETHPEDGLVRFHLQRLLAGSAGVHIELKAK
jgi:adenylate cyclase